MTENQHLISIIMPVRDTENYVGETLDSIVNQSFQNWELIAVNDNSSDNSLGVMLPYTVTNALKSYQIQIPDCLMHCDMVIQKPQVLLFTEWTLTI